MHDVAELVAVVEVAQHAHDRRDPAARADEEQLLGQRVGQDEVALDAAEPHERAGLRLAHEVRRDRALLDELRRDADAAVGAVGSEVSE